MLFVMTNNGGPLQWIGLILFVMQAIIPQLLMWLEDSDYATAYYYDVHGNVYRSGSNDGRRGSMASSSQNNQRQQRTTPQPEPPQQEQAFNIQGIQCSCTFLVIMGLMITFWMICSRDETENESNNNGTRTNATDTARGQNQQQNIDNPPLQRTRFQILKSKCLQMKNKIRSLIARWTGWETSDFRFSFLEGLAVGMLIMKLSFIADFFLRKLYEYVHNNNSSSSSDNDESFFSTSTLIYWIPYVHQFMGLCALGFELCRRGGFIRPPPAGAGGATFTREQQQAKMNRMVELIHKVPLETFVSQQEEGEDDGLCCLSHSTTVSQLKNMLKRRGVSQEEIDSYVDRQNLIDRLKQCRQYSDTCCICFESYQEGEPIRVLPQCHHELHVECLDKWVYTFANNPAKLQHEPTCPMCKADLKCTT